MTNPSRFQHPQEVIGKYWKKDQSPEQARALSLARDALLFVSATGQRYLFEDFRKGLPSRPSPQPLEVPPTRLANLRERLSGTVPLFLKLQDATHSAGEKELIQIILDTLHFISSTGQYGPLCDFIEHVESKAPPYVVASFDSREEAEAWLLSHPQPPDAADVLIANTYHDVVYDRETNLRRLPWNRDLERHLAWLDQVDPPVAVASFATREEADAWLKAQPNPERRAWVLVGNEIYLAAYYPNINHRALFPLSMAKGHESEPEQPQYH
jgi:hypothetical protein